MKIITQQLSNKLSNNHELLSNQIVNPIDHTSLKLLLQNTPQVIIYDLTKNNNLPKETIIGVKNHINRTGSSPLVGFRKILKTSFIDLTNLYQCNNKAVITNCCGEKLNKCYKYPSYYLCHISILAKALGIQKIKAFLVNIP